MGDPIKYRDKFAYLNITSTINSIEDPTDVTKYVLSFDKLEDLAILLNMEAKEDIFVGNKRMSFADFQELILKETHKIYPYKDGLMFDRMNSIS
ncbi:MAG: hypothetical protein AABW50_02025 [Nanoarchaeota archaeon]